MIISIGALLLDGGIEAADRVLSNTLFEGEEDLKGVWTDTYLHPLQADEPEGDRAWIKNSPQLQVSNGHNEVRMSKTVHSYRSVTAS